MTTQELPNITHCGLPGIDLVPLGMHACHFYRNREQLAAAVVPYLLAGLRANERCIWITAPPLPEMKAVQALRNAWDGIDRAIESGALRVSDFDRWYAGSAGLKGLEIVEMWLQEEQRALAEGYKGLRITGNISFLQPHELGAFVEYEQAVSDCFSGRRIVALCSYPQRQHGAEQMSSVLDAHHCAFERTDTDWHVATIPEGRSADPMHGP